MNYYSLEEKNFVLELVKEKANIIENQENTIQINRKKNEEWKRIAAEVNSKYNTNRTAKSIVNLYRKMKSKAKSEMSEHKRYSKGTGGGPATQISDVTKTFSSILKG